VYVFSALMRPDLREISVSKIAGVEDVTDIISISSSDSDSGDGFVFIFMD